MADTSGPYLAAAFVCERVLQEADGVVSAIRIIDRLTQLVGGPDVPDELQSFQQPVTIFIGLKAGSARGRYKVRLQIEKPSGEQGPHIEAPVHFEGEERGVNMILNTLFEADQEGLYWFDVIFQNERITRIPLRVIYQPHPQGGPGG